MKQAYVFEFGPLSDGELIFWWIKIGKLLYANQRAEDSPIEGC